MAKLPTYNCMHASKAMHTAVACTWLMALAGVRIHFWIPTRLCCTYTIHIAMYVYLFGYLCTGCCTDIYIFKYPRTHASSMCSYNGINEILVRVSCTSCRAYVRVCVLLLRVCCCACVMRARVMLHACVLQCMYVCVCATACLLLPMLVCAIAPLMLCVCYCLTHTYIIWRAKESFQVPFSLKRDGSVIKGIKFKTRC